MSDQDILKLKKKIISKMKDILFMHVNGKITIDSKKFNRMIRNYKSIIQQRANDMYHDYALIDKVDTLQRLKYFMCDDYIKDLKSKVLTEYNNTE